MPQTNKLFTSPQFVSASVILESVVLLLVRIVPNALPRFSFRGATHEGESLRKDDADREANSLEETEFLFDSDLIKKPSFLRM